MTTAKKLESLKKKIASLLAMTQENGATEAEALNAISLAAKLMADNGITEEDIKNSVPDDYIKETFSDNRSNRHEVDLYLSGHIARYCGVKFYSDRDQHNRLRPVFFGYSVDVELAKYLRIMCRFALEYEWSMFAAAYTGESHGRTLRKSFMIAMCHRIGERLRTMKPEAEAQTGTALLVLKNQTVEQEFAKRFNLKLRKGPRTTYKINDAYHAGRAAGDKVDLHRKDEGGSNQKRITR